MSKRIFRLPKTTNMSLFSRIFKKKKTDVESNNVKTNKPMELLSKAAGLWLKGNGFIYKCHNCGELLTAEHDFSGTQVTCKKCNTSHVIPLRISNALNLLINLERSNIDANKYPNIFYHIDLEKLKKLLIVFDVKLKSKDYFSYNSQEIQIPGTKTLFVYDDKSNTMSKEIGELGIYLDNHLFFIKGVDDKYYCFGDNKYGLMMDQNALYSCISSVERSLNSVFIESNFERVSWDESLPVK